MQNLLSQLKKSKKKKTMFQLGAALVAALLAIIILLVAKPKRPTRKTYFTQIKTQKEDLTKESWLATATEQLEKQSKQIEELKRQLERLKSKPMPEMHGKPDSGTKSQPLHTPHYTAPPPPPPPSVPEKKEIKPELMTDLIEIVKPKEKKPQIDVEKKKEGKKRKTNRPLTVNKAIPAGSTARGILLTGLDAPTGGKAKSDPRPVEVLLTDYTILPNGFKADLRGCFLLGDGYGDLSSEKTYIRLTLLSCVRENGEIIQRKIDAYAVSGDDGKAGLKGRVVSKQGSLLARSLIAGFLEGGAQAMQQQGMIISISPLGQTQTISDVGKVAAYSAAGKAAEKLADFYMKLVNETFPVVETNAGRKVDVVFLKEVKLFEDAA